jgi:hypothetical protein
LVARFIERPSTWGYLGQLFAISGWTSLPWLGSLRQPTLVLAGDDDPIVPLVNGRILARCTPTCGCTSSGAAATCSCWSSRHAWPRWSPTTSRATRATISRHDRLLN